MPLVRANSSPARTVIAGAAVFWAIAIVIISVASVLPPVLSMWVRAAVICIASGIAARRLAPDGDVDKTIAIGLLWLALSIVAEVIVAGATGRPFALLLGSTGHPLVRGLTLLLWVATPSLFVRCDVSGRGRPQH